MPHSERQFRSSDTGFNIGDAKVLDAAGERSLSQLIEAGDIARNLLNNPDAQLTDAERQQLEDDVARGAAAETRFVLSNTRLVVHVIGQMSIPSHVDKADLFQRAVEALHRAVAKFDWRKGFKFSTYATAWIRQAVLSETTFHTTLAKGVASVKAAASSAERARETLTTLNNGVAPTDDELAEFLGITTKRLREIRQHAQPHLSFEEEVPSQSGSGLMLGDTIADESATEAFQDVEHRAQAKILAELLETLPDAQREALLMEMNPNKPSDWKRTKHHQAAVRSAMSRLRHPSCRLALAAMDTIH